MINSQYKLEKYSQPYGIWILDNFLDKENYSILRKQWPSHDESGWNKGVGKIFDQDGVLENKMLAMSGKEVIPETYQNFLNFMQSSNTIKIIEKITGIQGLIADEVGRWSGLRETLAGGHQLIHTDARQHLETGYRKELTLLLYLNEDYDPSRDEGCLEIWDASVTKKIYSLPPLGNRLIIFHNTDTSYHGVPITLTDRKMITLSFLKEAESSGVTRARFVPRPQDPPEVKELAESRLQVQDKFKT
jgi:hypothetical protein